MKTNGMHIRVDPKLARRIKAMLRSQPHWKSANQLANYALTNGMKAAEQLTQASKA